MKYILSIDQSTSGTKALIFDETSRLVGRADLPHRQIIHDNGYVEHDGMEIYQNVIGGAKKVLEQTGVSLSKVAAVGISNQRETAIMWDKTSGQPVYNAIVWQCARGEGICRQLEDQNPNFSKMVWEHTGLHLYPTFLLRN